jgi:hypothetical protein
MRGGATRSTGRAGCALHLGHGVGRRRQRSTSGWRHDGGLAFGPCRSRSGLGCFLLFKIDFWCISSRHQKWCFLSDHDIRYKKRSIFCTTQFVSVGVANTKSLLPADITNVFCSSVAPKHEMTMVCSLRASSPTSYLKWLLGIVIIDPSVSHSCIEAVGLGQLIAP